jgi:hypothetical protein
VTHALRSALARTRPEAAAWARTVAVSLALSVFFVAQPVAHAGPLEDFLAARERYEAQDWQGAIDGFEPLVGGESPRLESLPLVLESRQYLATAYLFVGREGPAVAQLERLIGEDPSYQIDAAQFPREVVQLFDRVRQRLAERREAQAERARLAAEVERLSAENAAMRAELEAERTLAVPRSQWFVQIPFGVGQFENGEEALGWFFAVAELLAGAGALATLIAQQALVAAIQNNGMGVDGDLWRRVNDALDIVEPLSWTSSALFGVLVAAGMIQANLAFAPTRSVRVPGRAPLPIPVLSLRLEPSFVGCTVGVTATF